MRLYIDIAHPAYAHALRFFIMEMRARGHEVLISARDKDITHCLLRAWGIPFIDRGKGSTSASFFSLPGKVTNLLRAISRLLPVVWKFRPDLVVSYSSYQAALTGRLLGRPVITFEDTENVPLLHLVNRTLSSHMVTPECFEKDFGSGHLRFNGYKELASLHPSRFKPVALPEEFSEPYILMRFVAWKAWHDRGHSGISDKMKIAVAESLSEFGRVFISSEKPLEGPLKKYGMDIDCSLAHSVLAGARLFFGESASMAAEAAVLGIPSVYIDNEGRGYTWDLESRYGLMFTFGEDDASVQLALEKAVGLLRKPDIDKEWQLKRNGMLVEKTDVTSWMVELAERWG